MIRLTLTSDKCILNTSIMTHFSLIAGEPDTTS